MNLTINKINFATAHIVMLDIIGTCYVLNSRKTKILMTAHQNSMTWKKLTARLDASIGEKADRKLFWDSKIIYAKETYDPHSPLLIEIEDETLINLYKKPSHMSVRADAKPDIKLYHQFMDFLFPSKESREVAERWVGQSLCDKAMTHLLLVGMKGCGKSFFANNILANLHGSSNFYIESNRDSRSNFDGNDYCKTLIFIDECEFGNESEKSRVKYRINRYAGFNLKYKTSSDTIRSWSSMVYACNYAKSVLVEIDDRCFTVPDLTNQPALINPEYKSCINQIQKISEPTHPEHKSFFAGVYRYITEKYPDETSELISYTESFKNLILQSDCEPRKTFFRFCLTKPDFTYPELDRALETNKKCPVDSIDLPTVKDAMQKFKEKFGVPLADYDPDDFTFTSKIYNGGI